MAPEAPAAAARARMSTATARRRIAWNASGLALFWCMRWAPQLGLEDVYFQALDMLMQLDVPHGTDELIDATLTWLQYALSIVFAWNLVEAVVAYCFPPQPRAASSASIPSTPVGEALARRVSKSAVGSTAGASVSTPASASARPTFQTSPVTPAPGSSTWRRSVSPSGRTSPTGAARTSPFRASGIGLGRPSTVPFQPSRSMSPQARLSSPFARTPSRAVSPNTHRHWSPAASMRADYGTFLFANIPDDAQEVERVLQGLGKV